METSIGPYLETSPGRPWDVILPSRIDRCHEKLKHSKFQTGYFSL